MKGIALHALGLIKTEPHDMAAAKCLIGREKDRIQLGFLLSHGYIDFALLENRLTEIELTPKSIVKSHQFLDSLVSDELRS